MVAEVGILGAETEFATYPAVYVVMPAAFQKSAYILAAQPEGVQAAVSCFPLGKTFAT